MVIKFEGHKISTNVIRFQQIGESALVEKGVIFRIESFPAQTLPRYPLDFVSQPHCETHGDHWVKTELTDKINTG